MPAFSKTRRAIKNPNLVKNHISSWAFTQHDRLMRLFSQSPVKVMDEDWDNLIIIDACRYDTFNKYFDGPQRVSRVLSGGSHTRQFLKHNFDRTYFDTVYISATPQFISCNLSSKFHDDFQLWDTHWNSEHETVHPEDVFEFAIDISEKYDNKRLIVHFIQPHYPFIGPTGNNLIQKSVTGGLRTDTRDSIWSRMKKGEVSGKSVIQAYEENAELVIPIAVDLAKELSGLNVITSDHGNAFGRYGIYGHPQNTYLSELVYVPWVVFEHESRKRIHWEKPNAEDETERGGNRQIVQDRLEHLGYK